MSTWSIVVPRGGTNFIPNPSFERNLTNYGGFFGGTISRTIEHQYCGVYGLACTVNSDGTAGIGMNPFIPGFGTHTCSAYVLGGSGVPYIIQAWNGVTPSGSVIWTANGTWQRKSFQAGFSGNYSNLRILKYNSADTTTFYVDGLQVEPGTVLTTYIDGTQPGCSWIGEPHNSTSIREATSAAGGVIVDIDETAGLYIETMSDVGMPPVQNIIVPLSGQNRAYYQNSFARPRTVQLTILAKGTSLAGLHAVRSTLVDLVKPDRIPTNQPMIVHYTLDNTTLTLSCVYDAGLEASVEGVFHERIPLRLIAYDPFWYADQDSGQGLPVRATINPMAYVAQRSETGWQALPGLDNTVRGFTLANNVPYAGGDFTNFAAQLTHGTWVYPGTINAPVYALATDPGGTPWIAGAFRNASGTGVARLSGGTWTMLNSLPGTALALAFDVGGTAYVGGEFGIRKWTGTEWGTIGPGIVPVGTVHTIAIGYDGRVYAAGDFIQYNHIAQFGTAWGSVSTGMDGPIFASDVQADGGILFGGTFLNAGGQLCSGIAKYNGYSFERLGRGIPGVVYAITHTSDGLVYVAGSSSTAGGYTTASGLPMPDSLWQWSGSEWYPVDINLPGTPDVRAVSWNDHRKHLLIGFNTSGSAVVSGTSIIHHTDGASANTYPIITITGPGRLYSIRNETTGDQMYFNVELLSGETVTLDLSPDAKTLSSNARTLQGAIRPGSDLGSFRILPGTNTITVFVDHPHATATMRWKKRYWSIDGIV